MRIETKNFKKYYNVLSEFYAKGGGDEKTEGIYLDFNSSNAYVQNTNSGICGKISFKFDKEENDQISNFTINIRKFLNICQTNDFILLDNDKVFYTEGSSYKLHVLSDSDMTDVIELFEKSIDYNNSITFDEKKLEELKKASKYLYKKMDFPYRAIYIQNNFICSLLSDQIYEAKFDCSIESIEPIEDISIYNDFSVFISMFDNDEAIILHINDQYVKLQLKSDNISLIMPKINLPLPTIHTDEFISQYDVSQVLEFKVDELVLGLAILAPYYKNSKLHKIALIVDHNLSNKIILKFEEEGEIINREVEYISKEEIDDLIIYLDGDAFKKAIDTLGGDIIKLSINSNADVNLICIKSDLDSDRKVLLSLLK